MRSAAPTHEIVELIIDEDELVGRGGFLAIRRLRMRNRRADGTASAPYVCDSIARPYGQDAVVVAVYARTAGGIDVLVRDGLRPALRMGRDPARAPLPEPPPGMFLTELVAGIVEPGDTGADGLRQRAAHEVEEEAGFTVDPAGITLLGAGSYPSPGSMVEKFYFAAVEVDPAAQQPLAGDGSPMEEGARTRWLPLDDAIAACVRGDLVDLKTELGLRRLRDHLAPAGGGTADPTDPGARRS
ncbi:MAG: NUDIX hydrolase [Deltaproteobacteria bacterium]|nr:MAG: NUDIX hydrolase [Deltaproteobacteria bacterium]TMQ19332.1 MAG: NUDIX hydrolase [Deltaproteobacteria bacterium]